MKTIGMVGIGLMGHGIATNLVRRGHALTVLDHPGNQPLDALKAAGATGYSSARALAADSEVVILVLTGSAQVEQVLCGADGVLEGLKPGSIVIDCSTSMPESTRRMAQQVQARGSQLLDAPMTRTPKEAAEGRLNLLVGGDAAVLDRCRPLLSCFAENIAHAGPTGAGHSLKLLHNFVSLGSVTLLAEAAACARRSGIDDAVFVEVLDKGGGWGAALERLKPYLLRGDPSGLRFSMANALKDLGYYADMAHASGAHDAAAKAIHGTLDAACQAMDPQTLLPELVGQLAQGPLTPARSR